MKRIDTQARAIDLFGAGKDGFKVAVPGVSDPTYCSAKWFNFLQEAIVRTIEQAGLVPSDDYDQFAKALTVVTTAQATRAEVALAATQLARDVAVGASTASTLALAAKDTIALGRASVADGATFWVRPNSIDGLARYTNYLRISSTTHTFIGALTDATEFDAKFLDIDDATNALYITDGSADKNILALWNRATGQMTFAPDDATQRTFNNANNGFRKGTAALMPSGERLAGMIRSAPTSALGTVASSTIADSALSKIYSYTTDPSLFTVYGGAPGVYGTFYLKVPCSIKPSGGNTSATLSQVCARVAIMTDAPALEFKMGGSNTKWRVFVDGMPLAEPQAYASSTGSIYNKITFPAAKAEGRRIDIEFEQNAGIDLAQSVKVAPGYSIWAVDRNYITTIAAMADSYGESAGSSYSGFGWAYEFGRALGGMDVNLVSCSNGGTGFIMAGSGYAATNSIRLDHLASFNPAIVVVALGINDSSQSAAAITAAALLTLQGIRSRLPNAAIVVVGAWAGSTGPSAAVLATENAILAAVNQMGDALCQFIPVSTVMPPWIAGTGRSGAKNGTGNSDWIIGGTTGVDSVHPTDSGHLYLGATRMADAVRPLLRQFRMN